MRSSNSEEASYTGDAWEIFTQLIILVVEGRTPGGEKGYHAGPHCPQPQQSMGNRHVCEPETSVCARAESLVKQLRLMWGVGVGVSVEVLLAPDCPHGVNIASTLDTSSAPSPNLQLLEQWNFNVFDKKMADATSTGWALVAAVRSFLHFSQLSAWLSSSGGCRPPNVLYRLTVSSPVFCSKFSSVPEQHHFPTAHVGPATSIKVVVRSLPRIEQIPLIKCLQSHSSTNEEANNRLALPQGSLCEASCLESKQITCNLPQNSMESGCLKEHETYSPEEDLRRCMMKAKLTETARVSRSESPDTQLGESLLDPPNTMSRLARRFQSPSRSGSPSLETPEHLICKVRQPGPSHSRPPDSNPFLSPVIFSDSQHLNPFAWTQTRYPTPHRTFHNYSSSSEKGMQPLQGIDLFKPSNLVDFSVYDQSKPHCFFNSGHNYYHHTPFVPHFFWPPTGPQSSGHHPENVNYFSTFDSSPEPLTDKFSDIPSRGLSVEESCNSLPIPSVDLMVQRTAPAIPSSSFPPNDTPKLNSSSPSRKVESQGTKRKVVDHMESPSKRESPPHLFKDSWKNRIPSGGTGSATSLFLDDQELPFKKTGKHFCPSLEDLTVICDSVKQNDCQTKLSRKNKVKSSFELTPKETREVLTVLRQHVDGVSPKKSPGNFPSGSGSGVKEKIIYDKVSSSCDSQHRADKISSEREAPKLRAYRSISECVDRRTKSVPCKSSNELCDSSVKNFHKNDCHYKTHSTSKTECPLDTFLHNARNLSKCVEAKTVTEKTKSYVASSEPTHAKSDPIVEQSLEVKSPSPTISSLKRSTPCSFENEKQPFGESSKVQRYLDFADVKYEYKTPAMEIRKSDNGPDELLSNEYSPTDNNLFKRLLTSQCFSSVKSASDYKQKDISRPRALEKKEASIQREDDPAVTLEEDKEVDEICKRKGLPIPTPNDQEQFRRSLESAANLVFHNKTGLPLTSSPAPMRKGHSFDYDSSLVSVAAIKSALRPCDREKEENDVAMERSQSIIASPEKITCKLSSSAPATVTGSSLLGSFEESVLNGRLEPFSTVQGFTAEIAAAGSFCPKHITKPVTVFFYSLRNNHTMSSPYMGHVSLSKKGYHIPSQGTLQVTLFNPHRTVVKMFVVMYDLSDMPPNSKTFLRQRTLNMPVDEDDSHPDAHQWLRYLIHLRFASSKSGKIYLHTDIRIMIFRRCDVDAAVLHQTDTPYEVRSFTHGPSNPKFSPRR